VTWRDETCRACRTARRDTLVTTSATGATRTTRVQRRHHSVDWGGHVHLTFFQKLFLRLMQIQSTKDWTCTREHYCFFGVRHVGTSAVRVARHARYDVRDTHAMYDVLCHVETWRDEPIWAYDSVGRRDVNNASNITVILHVLVTQYRPQFSAETHFYQHVNVLLVFERLV